jgi:hypothetical protein
MLTGDITNRLKQISPIVCFAGCDWWYHNRGLFVPQVMTRLAKRTKVLFVNSLGMRVPSLQKDRLALHKIVRKIRSFARFLRKDSTSGMYILSPVSLPLWGSTLGRVVNAYSILVQVKLAMLILRIRNPIFYVGCPPAWEVIKRIHYHYLVYERTDLFEEMPEVDKPYITFLDNDLMRLSNLVLYVDAAMYNDGVKQNPHSLLIGHGVDFYFFADAEKSDYIPEDVARIPKPIIGYFGDICDKTFDFDLLQHLAANLPDMSFVLIGPLSSDVECLRKFKNIYILGQKAYEDIPHYGKVFDVSILPWKKNKWVIHSYPVKIKEYLALGNPFVSVDIPAVRPFSNVTYVACDYDDCVSKVRRAAKDKDPQNRQKRKESVRNETWDSKVEQILDFINKDADGKHISKTTS